MRADTAIIFYCQLRVSQSSDVTFKNTLVEANRAWLTPSGLGVAGDIDGDKDVPLKVFYANVGRGPALKTDAAFEVSTAPQNPQEPYEGISGGTNDLCSRIALKSDPLFLNPSK
jgi:hypothetical protein